MVKYLRINPHNVCHLLSNNLAKYISMFLCLSIYQANVTKC